jgi:hypothetical protein
MSSSGFGASVVSRRSDASPTARVLILLRTSACHPEARASRRQYALTSRPARRSLANEQVGGPRTAEPVRLGGCCDPHYEARPCQLADLVFSHPGCADGAIPDLGAGRRSEHVRRSPSGLDRVETVLRAPLPGLLGRAHQTLLAEPSRGQMGAGLALPGVVCRLSSRTNSPRDAADRHDRWVPCVIHRLGSAMYRCGQGPTCECALQPLHPANRTRGPRLRASHDWRLTRCQPRSARPSRSTQVRPRTLAKTMSTLSQVRARPMRTRPMPR